MTCDADSSLALTRAISSRSASARLRAFRPTSYCTFQLPSPHRLAYSHLIFDILKMTVSDRECQVQMSNPPYLPTPRHTSYLKTAGLNIVLPSLQFLSMILTNSSHMFKIPYLLYRNIVIDVHLYLGCWPKPYWRVTFCLTMGKISKRQSSILSMLYCYHFPSRETSFQLS
jgi:hypothetical protein